MNPLPRQIAMLMRIIVVFYLCTVALSQTVAEDLSSFIKSLNGGTTSPAASQATPRSNEVPDDFYPKLHALCIGVNKYNSPDVPPLAYAENDASEMAKVLKERYGFSDIVLLLGKDATREKITGQLARLQDPDEVSDKDGVVIFFSGHGQTVSSGASEQGYLLPVDAEVKLSDFKNPAPYRRTAIRMDDLRADADAIPARHVLFLMDSCFSGYMATKAVDSSPEIKNALRYTARQVITAGGKGETVLEHHAWQHGALTYKLLEMLNTEKEPVTAAQLGLQLRRSVPQEVAARYEGKMVSPQCKYLSGEGDFLFLPTTLASVPPPRAVPQATPVPQATAVPATPIETPAPKATQSAQPSVSIQSTESAPDAGADHNLQKSLSFIASQNGLYVEVDTATVLKKAASNRSQKNRLKMWLKRPGKVVLTHTGDSKEYAVASDARTQTVFFPSTDRYTDSEPDDSVRKFLGEFGAVAALFLDPDGKASLPSSLMVRSSGTETKAGVECEKFRVETDQSVTNVWIARGEVPAPVFMEHDPKQGEAKLEMNFRWRVNVSFADVTFRLNLPKTAKRVASADKL